MYCPTALLIGLHNYRCSNHDCQAYFSSGDILIKHYGIVGTTESRITLLRFTNFLRQPNIHELCYNLSSTIMVKVIPSFQNMFYGTQNVKNDEILVCLSMQIMVSSRNTWTQRKLLHLVVQTIWNCQDFLTLDLLL